MEIRSDQADITLTVQVGNGRPKQYGGTWQKYQGGGLSASDSKTRPGGMGKKRSVGGPADRGDVTLTCENSDVTVGFHNELEDLVGRQDVLAIAGVQYLNPDGSIMQGALFGRGGTIKEATLPDTDEDSGDVGEYTVVLSAHELRV